MKQKIKEFFSAFRRYPGFGVYIGFGRGTKTRFKCDRNGFVLMFLGIVIVGSTYDFIESSGRCMVELMELRKENAMMQQMYSGRKARRP